MLSKAKGDDVELGATLLQNEQKVDLHVPESPGKSWWNLKMLYTLPEIGQNWIFYTP